MATFRIRLVRSGMHVVLSLTEGMPLAKGTWMKLEGTSLQADSGLWENWILGDPGGSANIRLYDDSNTKTALLKNYVAGTTEGDGEFLLTEFGGAFGGDPFRWFST